MAITPNALSIMFSENPPKEFRPIVQVAEIYKRTDGKTMVTISDGLYFINAVFGRDEDWYHGLSKQDCKAVLIDYTIERSKDADPTLIINSLSLLEPIQTDNSEFLSRTKVITQEVNNLSLEDHTFQKINELYMGRTGWKVRARVITKYPIKNWVKGMNFGMIFKCIISDEDSTLAMATFFNDAATKYHKFIQTDKIYIFSNGDLKNFNQNQTSMSISIEMLFNSDMSVEETYDKTVYNFVPLSRINSLKENSIIDACGVVIRVNPIQDILSKRNTKNVKRVITLIDQSNIPVEVGLWDDYARDPIYENMPTNSILYLKNIRTTYYHGMTLNSVKPSTLISLKCNDNTDYVMQLRSWALSNDKILEKPIECKNVLRYKTTQEAIVYRNSFPTLAIKESILLQCSIGKIDITSERLIFYQSCSAPFCKKKVRLNMHGYFFCVKCERSSEKCIFRYSTWVKLSDQYGEIEAIAFDDLMKQLIGIDAETLKDISLQSKEEAQKFLDQIEGKNIIAELSLNTNGFYNGHLFTLQRLQEI